MPRHHNVEKINDLMNISNSQVLIKSEPEIRKSEIEGGQGAEDKNYVLFTHFFGRMMF